MLFFNFGGVFYASVLLINAVAILSEDRFLARIGWSGNSPEPGFGAAAQDSQSIKARTISLITSVRTLMRIPLIVINSLIIAYELILG